MSKHARGFKRFIAELDEDDDDLEKIIEIFTKETPDCPGVYNLNDSRRYCGEHNCAKKCWKDALENKCDE
jgi:hypothetical protein